MLFHLQQGGLGRIVNSGIRQRVYVQLSDIVASTDTSGSNGEPFTRNRSTDLVPTLLPNKRYLVRGMLCMRRAAASPSIGVRISRSDAVDQLQGSIFGLNGAALIDDSLAYSDVGYAHADSTHIPLPSDTNYNKRYESLSRSAAGARTQFGISFYVDTGGSPCSLYVEPYSDSATNPVTLYAGSYLIVDEV